MKLKDKVALVVGGSSGIGAATARLFAKEGAGVMVGDIQDDLGATLVAEVKEAGGKALFQHLDVRSSDQWPETIRVAIDKFGKLDTMVYSAGANFRVGFEEQTEQMWDHVMAVNVKGCFLGIKAVAPEMRRAGGGAIVIIASVAGTQGVRGGPAYSSSKAAVINLARCAALTYAQDKIRVNTILPGFVDTPFLRGVKPHSLNTPETDIDVPENYHRRVQGMPLGRFARPEDIAKGALYLASADASLITGTGLVIDGGMLA